MKVSANERLNNSHTKGEQTVHQICYFLPLIYEIALLTCFTESTGITNLAESIHDIPVTRLCVFPTE